MLIDKYLLLDTDERRPNKLKVLMFGIKINANQLRSFDQALRYVGSALHEVDSRDMWTKTEKR